MSSGTCLDSHQDGLITSCPWDPRIKGQFFHQTAFSIPLTRVKGFINDIKSLVKIEPKSLCALERSNGVLIRYVTSSSAFLGKEEKALDFDLTYYRSKDEPLTPRLYEDFIEEIEQMGIFKYNALPHWGKNRNLAFDGVIRKYKNANTFLKVKERFDPLGLFSTEWTNQILGLKGNVTIVKEGCALEGLCVCSDDAHCAPKKGYLCRPVMNGASPAHSLVSTTAVAGGGGSSGAAAGLDDFHFPPDIPSMQERKDEAMRVLKADLMTELDKEVKSLEEDSWMFEGPRSRIHLISRRGNFLKKGGEVKLW